jgi:hypothetical protein
MNSTACLIFTKTGYMKNVFLVFLCSFAIATASAQAVKLKEIKQGTVLHLDAYTQGQTYPLLLTVTSISNEELIFTYDFMGSMSGKFINSKANFEKGVKFNWDQPIADEERKVPDDQTLLVLSRTALKDLKSKKQCAFNEQTLVLKDLPAGQELSLGGLQLDAVYAESADGGTKYWILNNDLYPVLLKLTGNPGGIDIEIKEFK